MSCDLCSGALVFALIAHGTLCMLAAVWLITARVWPSWKGTL